VSQKETTTISFLKAKLHIPPLRSELVSRPRLIRRLNAVLPARASFFAELMAYFDQVGEMGDPAKANGLPGAPATMLDAWIEQRTARGL
jgi:hypothetical protein